MNVGAVREPPQISLSHGCLNVGAPNSSTMNKNWKFEQKHLLLTGAPGCGKSSLILRLAEKIKHKNIRGFVTQEMREKGNRAGFKIKTFSGREGGLSHISIKSSHRVSKYGVNVEEFEDLVLPEIEVKDQQADVFLIDEIGKMECLSNRFVEAVKNILKGDIPTVATIAAKAGGAIKEIKNLPNTLLIEVTPQNRDNLPDDIKTWLEQF